MVDFNFEVSKSPTIHVEPSTLKRLESLRQKLKASTEGNLNYDAVIKYLLKLTKEKQNV